ncbi:MAG: diguanylate cyclase domain-containing protein [Succinivibrionaceae bacterium]
MVELEFNSVNSNVFDSIRSELSNLALTVKNFAKSSYTESSIKNNLKGYFYEFSNRVLNDYKMVSGIYFLNSDHNIKLHDGSKFIIELEQNEDIAKKLNDNFSSDRGHIFDIDDWSLIPGPRNAAIVITYPVFYKENFNDSGNNNDNDNELLGHIVVIVPYHLISYSIRPRFFNTITHFDVTPKTRDTFFNQDNFLLTKIQKLDLYLLDYDVSSAIYILSATNGNFVIAKQTSLLLISFTIFITLTLFTVLYGIVITSRNNNTILKIINRILINKGKYVFEKTNIIDIIEIDKILYQIWKQNKKRIDAVIKKNEKLIKHGAYLQEHKAQLEDSNKELSNKIEERGSQLKRLVSDQQELLMYYRMVLDLSEFLDKTIRSAKEIAYEIALTLKKVNIPYDYQIHINLGNGDEYVCSSSHWIDDYNIKNSDIDYSRKAYQAENNDDICDTLVFPMVNNNGLESYIFMALPNKFMLQYSQQEGILMICQNLASSIENTILRKRLEHLANIDELTGLCNRHCLEADKEAFKKKYANISQKDFPKFGIFAIDLNYLKKMNDTLGHSAGDALIKDCANCLRASVAGIIENRIYRIGGDEFIVAFMNPTPKIVEQIVNNFNKEMSLKRTIAQKDYYLSFCYGYAEASTLDECNKVILRADFELYKNKREYHNNNPI